MLITRTILNQAIENKTPLFHDGDFIDDDVLYDLFYAPREVRCLPSGKRNWAPLISKGDRQILCAELIGYKNSKEPYDSIYYNAKCKSCGKNVPIQITKGKIVNRSFKKKNCIKEYIYRRRMNDHSRYGYLIPVEKLLKLKFGDLDDSFVCVSCVDKFVSGSILELSEMLERKDKFDWYRSDEQQDDWKREFFYKENCSVGTKIRAVNGDCWTDEEYDEWQKELQQKKEEELNHQRKLEELRRQQKINEEAEREQTRRANELFLARHQSNTPTQNYINKFCNKNSNVDITDREVQQEALCPEEVNYDVIQKHNCKLYREYLESPLWKIISSKVKWNAHNRCEKCGSKSNLQVHHVSYEFKGVEFLAFETLKCLCSKCHKEEHDE